MWNFKSTGRVKTVDSQNPNVQGNVETYRSLTQAEYDELSYEEKHSGIVYFITDGATDHIAASSIRYDNSGTHIASTSVQGAIDALDAMLGAIGDGDLSELESIISSAEVVLDEVQPILPTSSGTTGQVLTKTASGADWQDATGGGGTVYTVNGISPDTNKNVQVDVELTQAEYDALPSSKNTDNVNYWIKDGNNNPANNTISASGVSYDNTTSQIDSDNVQDAIDTLNNGLTVLTFSGNISDFMRTYVPSKNLEQNRVYSATFTDPNWDSAFGWVMRIDTNSYVGEFSNTNGYHIWASNINGTFSLKAVNYQ